jgi:hypothetical protein
MKTNILKLTALGLLVLLANNASQAGEPNKKPTSATTTVCAIPGWYQEIDRHDGPMTVTCSLTTNNTCVYVPGPCNGTKGGAAGGKDVLTPSGLDVTEGQNFYARYDADGILQVNLITSYTTDIRTEEDGTRTFILTIQP